MPLQQATQKFIFAYQCHKNMADREIKKIGIHRSQYHLLMYLFWNPDVSQKQIAKYLRVSTATIAVAVKKLEQTGYIHKETNGKDNRFNRITLTEKGIQVVEASKSIVKKMEERTFKGFSPEEIEQFCGYLDRIYKNMEENLGDLGEETEETMRYIDMHVHSTYSDGMCTPKELVEMAQEKGLSAFALSDHDTVAGVKEALKAAEGSTVEVIPAIEVSAVYRGKDIHILGYGVNINDRTFLEQLDRYQTQRELRNEKMIRLLREQGFDITKEKLTERFPNAVLTRAHFARYLMEHGYVRENKEAFQKYIGVGCPCYLPKKEITPEEAIRCIRMAGGHPVLAHPLLYHLEIGEIEALVRYLIPMGLEGIEAIYSSNSQEDERQMRQLAKKFNLYITGGSDFHGSNKPDIQMGTGKKNLRVPEDLLKYIRSSVK